MPTRGQKLAARQLALGLLSSEDDATLHGKRPKFLAFTIIVHNMDITSFWSLVTFPRWSWETREMIESIIMARN